MSDRYDLTTLSGLNEAREKLFAIAKEHGVPRDHPFMKKQVRKLELHAFARGPAKWLLNKALAMVQSSSSPSTIEAQKNAAIDIINANKDGKVSSIRMVMSQQAGLELGSVVSGVPIKTKIGKAGSMEVHVVYRAKRRTRSPK